MNFYNLLKQISSMKFTDGQIKKPNPILKFLDKVFIARLYMAPVFFYGLMAGVILNGGTGNGMNREFWESSLGNPPFGESQVLTIIGMVLIVYGFVGLGWFIVRGFKGGNL